ncbi:MAG: nitroreductase family protein, partial [Clostridia bacterium]|nr:nitroreductase family protein [Clostridia bacterium]
FIDMGIAAEHFCLLAAESGIGTCILGWCRRKEIKKLLGIPSDKKVGLLISIGYPKNPEIRDKTRKTMDEMRSYNKY